MKCSCPKCQRPLYDRRRKTCGFCGFTLPADLQFSPAKVEELKQHSLDSEKREQQRKARQQAAKRRRQKDLESKGPQDICF